MSPTGQPRDTARSSDTTLMSKAGKTWDQWLKLLDKWDAAKRGHTATAAWLQEAHEVPGWWAQTVTVEYERSRGLREVGQKSSGDFEVSAQRSVPVPIAQLKAAWTDAAKRGKWLKSPTLRPAVTAGMRAPRTSKTKMAHMLRLDVKPKGSASPQRLELAFTGDGRKSTVSLAHSKIPDKAQRDALKAEWKDALDALKAHLSG